MIARSHHSFAPRAAAFLVTVTLLAAAPAVTAQSTNRTLPPAPRRPNIIFILADDLGYGDLGCYGQTRIKTPNLDQLAAAGIRFTDFYAGSTVCSPSRATFMLGKHTGHTNIRGNAKPTTLLPGEVTVAQVLKDAGYRTCLIGKWGLAEAGSPGVPQKMGFDEFVGYLSNTEAHDYYPDYLWRYAPPAPGFDGFDGRKPLVENAGGAKRTYIPDLCTEAALNFVRINQPDQFNRYRSFFLCLNYTIPHTNNEEGRRSGNGMQVPSDAPYSNEPWTPQEKNKAAMITRMDADIGRLLEQLQKLKLDTNTVIFFSSDNGPHAEGVDPKFHQSAGPFRGIKRDLYEGGIRVPMIVRWPAQIKRGQVSDFVWASWDFLPTAAAIAMTKPPSDLDGFSILPLLTGQAQPNGHDFLYWEFHERGFQQAVRMGDWKAVRPQADEPLELYNLKTDPGEKKNIAAENPKIVAQIEAYLKTARTESPRWPIQKPAAKPVETPK
jgi:arylsulfatase A-like enzyme